MRMKYMKASGFAKVTAVSREPGQEGFLFKYVCFNSISDSSIHLSPLKQRKKPRVSTKDKHHMIFNKQLYNQTPCNYFKNWVPKLCCDSMKCTLKDLWKRIDILGSVPIYPLLFHMKEIILNQLNIWKELNHHLSLANLKEKFRRKHSFI